ncbi:MAG: hypothetical protein ACTSYC_00980 [Promethearchaeota archaeon]
MPNKIIIFFKSGGRYWFLLLLFASLIVLFYNQQAALIIGIITVILYFLSFIPSLIFRFRLMRKMKKNVRIDDVTLARISKKRLRKVKNLMFKLSKNQEKKKWLIIFFNKSYVFYAKSIIKKLMEFFEKEEDIDESQILSKLKTQDIKSKDELKVIRETLVKFKRLEVNK